MMRISMMIPATAVALTVLTGAASAQVFPDAASTASAANVSLNLDGEKFALGNQVYAAGHAPPAYNSRTSLPSYSKNYASPSGVTVAFSGGSATSIARSAGAAAGEVTAMGATSLGTFSVSIGTPLGTLLSISGSGIVSRSTFTATRGGKRTPVGYANIGKLTINAPDLGLNNKNFSGSPKVNQILFQSPDKSVTVYGNRQVVTMAAGKPTSISVDAVAVVFSDSVIKGNSLSADVVLAATMAN